MVKNALTVTEANEYDYQKCPEVQFKQSHYEQQHRQRDPWHEHVSIFLDERNEKEEKVMKKKTKKK